MAGLSGEGLTAALMTGKPLRDNPGETSGDLPRGMAGLRGRKFRPAGAGFSYAHAIDPNAGRDGKVARPVGGGQGAADFVEDGSRHDLAGGIGVNERDDAGAVFLLVEREVGVVRVEREGMVPR